jgi:hypothetical protein
VNSSKSTPVIDGFGGEEDVVPAGVVEEGILVDCGRFMSWKPARKVRLSMKKRFDLEKD